MEITVKIEGNDRNPSGCLVETKEIATALKSAMTITFQSGVKMTVWPDSNLCDSNEIYRLQRELLTEKEVVEKYRKEYKSSHDE